MSSAIEGDRERGTNGAPRVLVWLALAIGAAALTAVVVVNLQIHGFRRPAVDVLKPSSIAPLTPGEALLARLPPHVRALYEAPAAGPAPAIELDVRILDLGVLNAGDSREVEIAFVNRGPGRLRIFGVRLQRDGTMGTAVVEGKPYAMGDEIPAGSRGSVAVKFMTRDFEGRLDVTLDVLTNDPRFAASSYVPKGIAAVTVRARVVKAFEFESGFPILTPAKIAPAGNPNEEAVVFSTDSRPFELRPTDTPTGDLTLDVSPVSPDRTRWRIRARIPLGARGPFPRIVRIPVVSSNPEAPKELYVTLTGSVR